jgi:ribosomal protein S18 acetylase RimI-like enzyme
MRPLRSGRQIGCFVQGRVRRVTIAVEEMRQVTDESLEAFKRLIPQLSRSAKPVDAALLERLVSSEALTLLLARMDGKIIGTLSLAMFPTPTGVRAWIEDVVVDDAVGRQGAGTALVNEALRIAREAGARTVDLTTRPAREAAGKLYEKAGFHQRDSRVYRYPLE